jgi:hypothetical protein
MAEQKKGQHHSPSDGHQSGAWPQEGERGSESASNAAHDV